MLYFVAITLGIAVGMLTGGSISNLFNVKFEKVWLIMSAAIIMTASQILGKRLYFISGCALAIQGVVFSLMLAGLWFNRKYLGIKVIGLGCFLNALVIMLNNGKMPVSYDALAKANLAAETLEGDFKHYIVDLSQGVKLAFLADAINPPLFLGYLNKIVSIGDLVVAAGLFLLTMQIAAGKKIGTDK